MITAGVGRNAIYLLLFCQFHYCIGRTAGFESAYFLEVLTFEINLTTCDLVDGFRCQDRCTVDKWLDSLMRSHDIIYGGKHSNVIHGNKDKRRS